MKSDRPLVTVPTAVRWSLLLLACLLAGLPYAASLEFDMIFQTKCIFEEVYEVDEKVTGTFNAFHKDNPKQPVELSLRIDSPSGQMVYEKRDSSSAAFSVPRLQEGEYKLCFTAKDYRTAQDTRINLRWNDGVDATDWESVAKKENLDSIHTELLRLEHAVHMMHLELQHIRRKEEEMRDVNELTNARVAWFSIGALATSIFMAGLQIWNLRKFFIRKKIL